MMKRFTPGLRRRTPRDVFGFGDFRIAAAPFAQKNFSILLDTRILEEQHHDHVEVSPFDARLPLRSPNSVSLKAKLRIER
jgi:hypothetical protein